MTIDNSVVSPAQTARNLGVTLDDQLSLTLNIAAIASSSGFILHNIRKMSFPHPEGKGVIISPRLLQVLQDWCTCVCHPTSEANPKCDKQADLQSIKVLLHCTTLHGYWWLLKPDSRHCFLPTMLSMTHQTPQPIHDILLLHPSL